jgi:hypothetical protein
MLGTMAGPVLQPARMMTGQAVVVDGDDPEMTDDIWRKEAAKAFGGDHSGRPRSAARLRRDTAFYKFQARACRVTYASALPGDKVRHSRIKRMWRSKLT